MAEPQNQDQPINPVTLHPGGAESAPVSAVPEQGAEPQVEVSPQLQPPEVSEDLRQAGVSYKTINPQVSQEAKQAGVEPSIPTDHHFVVPDFQTSVEAEKVAAGSPNQGIVWQATEWIKTTLKLKKAA